MSDEAVVTQIPTRLNEINRHLFVCGDEWTIECDDCGRRMPPADGLEYARALAEAEGWLVDPEHDRDVCAKCRRSER